VPWRLGGLFSTVFHAAGSGTAGNSAFPSQSPLADLSRTSTFSRNIWHPRLRTCSCPFTVVHFFKVDHHSLDCSIFCDSRCTATCSSHTMWESTSALAALHVPGTAYHSTPLAPIRRERLTVHGQCHVLRRAIAVRWMRQVLSRPDV
jgi:hypothetical protein